MRTLLLLLGILWVPVGQAGGLVVIASPKVPDNAISVEQLADIYTLKKVYWANELEVVPVNREAGSPVREKFSETIFNLPPRKLAEHWYRLRFQGKFPPLIRTSDEEVLSFVHNVPGAIGYIDASKTPTGVKVLMRIP